MHIGYNDHEDKWYIATSYPMNSYYLRKDGELHISTFDKHVSEGYWDTEEEAVEFLDNWLKDITPTNGLIKREQDYLGVLMVVIFAFAVGFGVFVWSQL